MRVSDILNVLALATATIAVPGIAGLAHSLPVVGAGTQALPLETVDSVLDNVPVDDLINAVPLDSLPVRKRALDLLPAGVAGLAHSLPVVGAATQALPLETVDSALDNVPIDDVVNALPLDSLPI